MPDEVLKEITTYLTSEELAIVNQISKRFHRIIDVERPFRLRYSFALGSSLMLEWAVRNGLPRVSQMILMTQRMNRHHLGSELALKYGFPIPTISEMIIEHLRGLQTPYDDSLLQDDYDTFLGM